MILFTLYLFSKTLLILQQLVVMSMDI